VAGHLRIICNFERLPALDTGDLKGFGMTLSVGWSEATAPAMEEALKPWLWDAIDKIQFYWQRDDGSNTTPDEVQALPQSPASAPEAFLNRLGSLYTKSAADPTNFQWPQTEYKLNDSAEAHPWHALLNHVATFPYPLAQRCNLSRVFRVRVEGKLLFAAPIIPASTTGHFPAQKLTPAGTATPTTSIPGKSNTFEWKYDIVTPFETFAFFQSVSPTVSQVEFINFNDQWLKLASVPTAATQEDWQADLEYRVAQGFQFTQFLLDFMRKPERQQLLEANNNFNRCIALALATLRDVAGPGANKTPEDIYFAQRIFETKLTPAELAQITPAMWASIDQALFTDTGGAQTGLEKWKKLLNQLLPEETKKTFLLTEMGPPVTSNELVAQLEKVFAQSLNAQTGISTLWKIFRQQWFDALPGSNIPGVVADKIRAALTETEVNISFETDLSRQLLLSHLGRFWSDFTKSGLGDQSDPLGRELITKCLPAFIRHYAELRLGLTGFPTTTGCVLSSTPVLNPPVPASLMPGADLQNALKAELEQWITNTLTRVSPNEPTKTTDVPHAITFQASPMIHENGPAGRDFDPLERISGLGVLMREQGKVEWLPLNLGEAYTDKVPLELGPMLVPYRLHYRNNLRQVCFSYNNQPLIASGPLSADKVTNVSSDTNDGGPSGASTEDLAAYAYTTTRRMPGLKFGSQYQFAVFAISNSGTLPAEVAAMAGEPWKLKSSITTDPPDGVASPFIPYKRLVKIGAPRLFNSAEEITGTNRFKPLSLPVIPAGVTPLAKDIDVLLERTSTDPHFDKRREQPILLVTPPDWEWGVPAEKHDNFEFRVKLPGIGWECWDRWVTRNDPRRPAVIADYFRQADGNRTKPQGNEVDLQLDDPAVVEKLFFILEKEVNGQLGYVGPLEKHFLQIDVPPNNTPGMNDLVKAQRLSVRVKCTFGGNEGLSKGTEQGRDFARVNVLEGTAYRLTICSAIRKLDKSRFGDEVLDEVPPPPTAPVTDLILVSATRLIIEAATTKLPDGAKLWDNLVTSFRRNGDNWILNARLEGKNDPDYRFLHRAEIDRQVWRWTGRPSETHPDLVAPDVASGTPAYRTEVLKWEAREFGERLDSELSIHNMLSEKKDVLPERKFLYDEILGDATSGKSKGLELRGLHFRFAVRAFSRYESILPLNARRSVETIKLNDRAENINTRWKSQFVPCRHTEELEAPKVKFMLPLTEGLPGDQSGSAGILVVLSEVWHQNGGIGEGIEAEVAMTPDPSVNPVSVKDFYFQIGPDPIVTANGRHENSHPEDDRTFYFDPLQGPVGHFYDVANRASGFSNPSTFFVNTSFVLPPPKMTQPRGAPPKKFGWHFAKVRLRRTQLTRLPLSEAAARADYQPQESLWKRTRLASKFTDPMWVQFLPDFSIYDGANGADDVSNLLLEVVTSEQDGSTRETEVILKKASGEAAKLKEFASDQNVFELYLVLTKRVFDVTGRNDQETYVGLFKKTANDKWLPADQSVIAIAGSPQSLDNYVARIIEVQRPKPFGEAVCTQRDNLWEELFGNTGNPSLQDCDTAARIVRISRPIENKPVSSEVICK
jgi:hypothetical protein